MLNEKEKVVAIWVGKIANPKVINTYLGEDYSDDESPLSPFAADLKSWYDHDFMDTNFVRGKGKSVSELLDPCSYSASYIEQTKVVAKKKRIDLINAVILLYDTEYTGKRWPTKSPLRFLGNFSYSTKPVLKDSPLEEIKGHTKTRVGPIGFSADDKYAVTCGSDGSVLMWNLETMSVMAPPKALTDGVSSFTTLRITDQCCIVSNISKTFIQNNFPDKKNVWKTIKTGLSEISINGSFGVDYETILDLKTGKASKHQPKDLFESSAFIDDQNLLMWTDNGELILWNAKTGKRKWKTDVRDFGSPFEISVSEDGSLAGACIETVSYTHLTLPTKA